MEGRQADEIERIDGSRSDLSISRHEGHALAEIRGWPPIGAQHLMQHELTSASDPRLLFAMQYGG